MTKVFNHWSMDFERYYIFELVSATFNVNSCEKYIMMLYSFCLFDVSNHCFPRTNPNKITKQRQQQ